MGGYCIKLFALALGLGCYAMVVNGEEVFQPTSPPPLRPLLSVNIGLSGALRQTQYHTALSARDPPTIQHPNLNSATQPTTLTGKNMVTANKRPIFGFQGIRFGAAPTGEKRFKKTVPAGVYWEGNELKVSSKGPRCPQMDAVTSKPTGDEDCLFVNVYTPYLPDNLPDNRKLPVLLFFYGGAFMVGDSHVYRPTYLLDNDVMLVVPQYRIGSLGFFSLDNDNATGNAGLWDQIEALRWVQDNIEGFGGDKTRVTIFGQGAGAASVNWHLLLPKTEGLFHGVIADSGSALEHWAHDPDPIGSARAVGKALGCQDWDDLGVLYECMRDMDAQQMVLGMEHFFTSELHNGKVYVRGLSPVTQSPSVSEEARLITKKPQEYFQDGDVKNLPLLIGANKHEGSFVLGLMYLGYFHPGNYIEDSDYVRYNMVNDAVNAFGMEDFTHELSESLQDAYFTNLTLTDFNSTTTGLIDLLGVLYMKAGVWRTANLHAQNTTANTYFYSFDFESNNTLFDLIFFGHDPIPFRPGVTVGDDLIYMFPMFPLDERQALTRDRLTRMWTNFAIYGNPTPDDDQSRLDQLSLPKWPALTPANHTYLLIQDHCTLQSEYPNRWHIAVEEDGQPAKTSTTALAERLELMRAHSPHHQPQDANAVTGRFGYFP